jgi:uncharacterized membrane protein YcfT
MDRHGNVTTTPSGFATSPGAKVPRSARTMLNITSLLNLLLSMALFVICLGALHYGPRTRRRFMLYVPVKLIVVAVGTLAVHRFIAATTWETANVLATIYAIAGALFPVLAIFLLSGRQVRAYFSSVGG